MTPQSGLSSHQFATFGLSFGGHLSLVRVRFADLV